MKQALLLLTICLLLFSCKKHTPDSSSFWPCDIISDSATISKNIIGSWKWTNYSCSTDKVLVADKDIKVTFNSNATYTVLENSSVIAQGTWRLKSVVTAQWVLDLSSPSDYLNGFVDFCDNRVAFMDSYVDGCNHYFEKTN